MAGPWYMVIVEVWISVLSPETCDRCRELHGREFDQGQGPQPPLHNHCHCRRQFSRIRYTQEEPGP